MTRAEKLLQIAAHGTYGPTVVQRNLEAGFVSGDYCGKRSAQIEANVWYCEARPRDHEGKCYATRVDGTRITWWKRY